MTPEARARQTIDALLMQAGWHVCNMADANIDSAWGFAIRDLQLNLDFYSADYPNHIDGKAARTIAIKKKAICRTSSFTADLAAADVLRLEAVFDTAGWKRSRCRSYMRKRCGKPRLIR